MLVRAGNRTQDIRAPIFYCHCSKNSLVFFTMCLLLITQ